MPTPETPPAGAPRRRLPLVVWILAALLVIVAIACVALAAAFPPARLRQIVTRQIAASLARDVRFGDAAIGVWPPVRLTIRDVALAEPRGFSQGAALRAASIHLDLDAWALLSRRLIVRRLAIDRPALHLVLKPDGSTNLDNLATPRAPARAGKPMDFDLRKLELRGGSVLVDDLAGRRRTVLGLGADLSCSVTGDGVRSEGETRVKDLRFGPLASARLADLNGSLAKLEWTVRHRAAWDGRTKRLALDRLALAFGRTEIALRGTADLSGRHPAVDLAARGRKIDLSEILGFLAAADARLLSGIGGSGRLEFDLAVRGVLAGTRRPTTTGLVQVRQGAFHYTGAPVGIERLALDARIAADSIVVPVFQASVSGQPVRGAVTIAGFDDPRVRFALTGRFDLAATSRFVAAEDSKIDGALVLDVRGAGRMKDPGAMALAGWAEVQHGTVSNPKLPSRIEQLHGRFEFSREQAKIVGLSATAGKSSFTLDATATRPLALLAKPAAERREPVPPAVLDFTLHSPYLDVNELVAPAPTEPVLPNARGTGRVLIGRLKQGRLDVTNVDATVAMSPTSIEATRFRFDGYGGAVSGKATIGLDDPKRPRIGLSAKIDSTRAEALLSTWTGAGKQLHGALAGTLDLSTDGISVDDVRRTLSAKGLASVANGGLGPSHLFEAVAAFTKIPAYKEVRFRDFTTPFRVEGGRVATGPAKLSGPYGDWTLAGTTGFDGSLDYAVSVTVPPELVSQLGAAGALTAGALSDDQGRMLLDLRVTGSARSPRVAWDANATRQRLLGKKPLAILEPVLGEKARQLDSLASRRNAVEDSLRQAAARAQRAVKDSLERAARNAFKNLFGGGTRDSTP